MILEVAMLSVRAGEGKAFEAAFAEAQGIVSAMPGYTGHELQRCLEVVEPQQAGDAVRPTGSAGG